MRRYSIRKREQSDDSIFESEIERITESEIRKALNEKTSEPDTETKKKFKEEDEFWRKQIDELRKIWYEAGDIIREIDRKDDLYKYIAHLTKAKMKIYNAMEMMREAMDMLQVYRNKVLQSTGEQPDKDYYMYGVRGRHRSLTDFENSKHTFWGKVGGTVK